MMGGLHGCPMCHDDINSIYEAWLGKDLYGHHRWFLTCGHSMRHDLDHWFNVTEEDGAMCGLKETVG